MLIMLKLNVSNKMVRNAYTITKKEVTELFLILSQAKIKLTGKYQTSAQKYWEKFEEVLGLSVKVIE